MPQRKSKQPILCAYCNKPYAKYYRDGEYYCNKKHYKEKEGENGDK